MTYFIGQGGYYEGDKMSPEDIEVTCRPDFTYIWVDGEWVVDPELFEQKIKAQIDEIEQREIMPRKTREIQIQLMEFLAAQQGITPQQLQANPAYAGMVNVDNQIKALRALL
jgi:hypothetical protein